jgi:hypothetical protein
MAKRRRGYVTRTAYRDRGVTARLRRLCGGLSAVKWGAKTRTHDESVRRYLRGDAPGIQLVQAVCRAYRISADWVLGLPMGRGAPRPTANSSVPRTRGGARAARRTRSPRARKR